MCRAGPIYVTYIIIKQALNNQNFSQERQREKGTYVKRALIQTSERKIGLGLLEGVPACNSTLLPASVLHSTCPPSEGVDKRPSLSLFFLSGNQLSLS